MRLSPCGTGALQSHATEPSQQGGGWLPTVNENHFFLAFFLFVCFHLPLSYPEAAPGELWPQGAARWVEAPQGNVSLGQGRVGPTLHGALCSEAAALSGALGVPSPSQTWWWEQHGEGAGMLRHGAPCVPSALVLHLAEIFELEICDDRLKNHCCLHALLGLCGRGGQNLCAPVQEGRDGDPRA